MSQTHAAVEPDQLAFVVEILDYKPENGTSIGIDSNDRPHIIYCKNCTLTYAHYNGSSWIIKAVENSGVDGEAVAPGARSLDLDSNNYPHISYAIVNYTENAVFEKYAYFNGDSWISRIIERIDGTSHPQGARSSIVLDSMNNPHISYGQLKYAHYNGSSWSIEAIDSFEVCLFQYIAIDLHGRPHIAYSRGPQSKEQNLAHAYFNGSSWVIEIVDAKNRGFYGSIAIDSQNNIHVTYSESRRLHYAYYNGASWNTQVVVSEDTEDVGSSSPASHVILQNSISLSSSGNPYIAYWRRTFCHYSIWHTLKLAYYNGSLWNVQTIGSYDLGGGVEPGKNLPSPVSSIAMDSRNYPHISFTNVRARRIGYARGGVPPRVSFTCSPGNPIVGRMVDFDASSSYDPDGTVAGYTWDFGDGTIINETDSVTTHTFMHVGDYTVTLRVVDDEGFSRTITESITVGRLYGTIDICLSSSTSIIGFKVEINGRLTHNNVGLSVASILVSYSVTEGESWNDITLASTVSEGGYSAVWMPSATGNYLVRAMWSGNATFWGASTTVNLAVIPFEQQNVFSVTSNSTVSELAFNSTSRELSFTITGPSGTKGYVDAFIAKPQIGNIENVDVCINASRIDYSAMSLENSWLLHFTYLHSTHKVTIGLGGSSVPFFEVPLGKAIMYGIPIAATIILALFMITKRKRARSHEQMRL